MDRLGVALALAAGVAAAIQGPMTTALMRTLGVVGASLAVAVVALGTALVGVALFGAGGAAWADWRLIPWWAWLSGAVGVVLIGALAIAVDRLGLATTAVVLLVGELACALLIDHFGLFGIQRIPLSPLRLLGVALAVVGVLLLRPE